jgi:hypothetical protein
VQLVIDGGLVSPRRVDGCPGERNGRRCGRKPQHYLAVPTMRAVEQ